MLKWIDWRKDLLQSIAAAIAAAVVVIVVVAVVVAVEEVAAVAAAVDTKEIGALRSGRKCRGSTAQTHHRQ
jgi:hypothetical protein